MKKPWFEGDTKGLEQLKRALTISANVVKNGQSLKHKP